MRSLIFVLVLFAVTVVCVIWIDLSIDARLSDIITQCEEIESANDVEEAEKMFDNVNKKWQSIRKALFAVLNHSDIDVVDYAVEMLGAAIESGDIDKIRLNACSLSYYLDDMLDTETLSLSNIL